MVFLQNAIQNLFLASIQQNDSETLELFYSFCFHHCLLYSFLEDIFEKDGFRKVLQPHKDTFASQVRVSPFFQRKRF